MPATSGDPLTPSTTAGTSGGRGTVADRLRFRAAGSDADFEQMLALQRANHARHVAADQHAEHGFVFAEHDLRLLRAMAAELPQVVAVDGDRVLGYNLAMTAAMTDLLPSLAPMFAQFARCRFRDRPLADYRFMVGGQVCVAAEARGHGLMARLYQATRDLLPPGYQLCVTEVAERNAVSLRAHHRMGFETIDVYDDAAERWHVVAWPLVPVVGDRE